MREGKGMTDASVIKVSSRRLFENSVLEKLWFESRGSRVTSRSRYTFSITRWIYSWHPVLRLTSSSPGCIGEKPVEATRGIPPRQLLPPPPRSILIIVMKFPGAARSRGSIELVVSFLGDASPDNYFDRRRWNARLFPTFSRDISNLVSRCRLEKKVTR